VYYIDVYKMASNFRRTMKFLDLERLSKCLETRYFLRQVNNVQNKGKNIRKGRNIKEEQNVRWNINMIKIMVIIIIT
jgi:hypothetical protein